MKGFIAAILIFIKTLFVPAGDKPAEPVIITPSSNMEIHFINVGDGDAVIIKNEDKWVVVDAGPRSATKHVIKYMETEKIAEIERVVATHPHEDHIGGIDDVIRKFHVKSLYLPKHTATTEIYKEMLLAAENKKTEVLIAAPGDEFNLGDAKFEVFAPLKEYKETNDNSIVMKLTKGNNTFLLTGDIEALAEADIAEKWGTKLKCDVLKAPHHGSETSSSNKLLNAAKPKYVIISANKNGQYNNPDDDVLEIYKEKKIQIYRTDLNGDIVINCNGESYEISGNR